MLRAIRDRFKVCRRQVLNAIPRFGYANPTVHWWRDRRWMIPFKQHLLFDGRAGTRVLEKRFMLIELAKSVANVRGCTAECGVAAGTGSALICQTLEESYSDGERHYAFDSFDGLPEPTDRDYMTNGRTSWYRGKLRHSYRRVQQRLSVFPKCQVTRGWIPECFDKNVGDERFRFVHIDVDLYEPTRASLEFFYNRLNPGGVILFDDYGFTNCPGARQAADEFFQERTNSVVEMTTGQAFVVKAA